MPPKPVKLGWNKTDDQKKATTEKIVDTWWEDEKFTQGREFEIQLVLEKQLGNLQCDISTTNRKTKKGLATVDYTADSVQATLGGKINPILKTNSVYVSVKNCLSFSEVNLSEHTFRICVRWVCHLDGAAGRTKTQVAFSFSIITQEKRAQPSLLWSENF